MESTSGRGAVGLLLAAGAGTRAGRPKALVRGADGTPWVARATAALLTGGCDAVVVVLGARADEARVLVPDDPRIRVVVADDWAEGLGASLRTGLRALSAPRRPDGDEEARCALVSLVDLPGLPPAAVARLLDVDDAARAGSLRQAAFGGRPGHPVLVGRVHWEPLAAELAGDSGARAYLDAHGADRVDCSDLWDGADVDRPA
ncbi:molybdenum cofactor cytidylyltransferase/nicotine blue oxidoreductase [Frigoribacterium sp. PhB160]|uniref:nucleotidyltransferase family protein n=1 Tax=Frigoribacterium sp. PhB160 TaxID=2485192 RepID=UPI000F4821C0|nr:nucleotidyltransferase family protein [Frigoribacterium sp. PhB160]ROS59269.1 molybdenum cofactor cytidylyltransferase/nicotine blue oxidoreductase [Frigoribacterium sp. PhB160]